MRGKVNLTRSVFIELREPQTKREKNLYGSTALQEGSDIAKVFINNQKRRNGESLNTFFHELTHVWFAQFSSEKYDEAAIERLACLVGNTVEAIVKS